MSLGPAPDWQYISWMVGNYNGEPILVTVDGLGQLAGGLGAFHDRYVQNVYRTSTGIDLNADTLEVPAGEVWVITNINVWHDDPISRQVTVYFRESTISHVLFRNRFLLQHEVMDRQGQWVLKESDYIRAVFVTPANGQHGSLTVSGYKVEVPT